MLKLITYKNKPYSIFIKHKGSKVIASINVNGAVAEGSTEDEAVTKLQEVLGKLEHVSTIGKDKLLLG